MALGLCEGAGDGADEGVGFGEGAVGVDVVDAEGGEAEGVELCEGEPAVVAVLGGFGVEGGVSVAGEFLEYFGVLGEVDIGGEDIDGGCASAPDVVDEGFSAAAGIIAGADVVGLDDPGVDVHGERVFTFSGGGDLADVLGVVPGHEDLVGVVEEFGIGGACGAGGAVGDGGHLVALDIFAEDFFPCAGGFVAGGVPDGGDFGEEVLFVGFEVVGELGGERVG